MLKILIVQTAFIGDVVLATALAEKLHHHYPNAQLDFLVRKGNEALFEGHPYINKVWVWNRKKNKYTGLVKLALEIKKHHYHKLINLQRFFSSGLLSTLARADETRGFNKNPFSAFYNLKAGHEIKADGMLHEVERNQLLIADLTGSQAAKPKLYPQHTDFESVAQYKGQSYICIAPCSVWFTKQYPETHWALFIKQVPAKFKVYLLGGPADAATCNRISVAAGNNQTVNLCGKLSYLQSAALMQNAVMNYVNDSAPMHFASAVNAPVTAIYCSTVPQFGYGPLSDNSTIIQTKEPLSCKPCGLHGYKQCPLKHFKCALTIAPETLLPLIDERRN
jgi:heptosyltransferase-2